MALDVKKEAKKVIDAIKKDPTKIAELTKDPVKFVEKTTGLDLPDDEINKVIALVKEQAKNIDMDDVTNLIGALSGKSTKKTTTSAKKTTSTKKSSSKSEGIDAEDIMKGVEMISKLMKK